MKSPPAARPATLFWQTGTAGDPWWERRPKLRGVNVGGWLVLEPWINTALFRAHPPAAGHGGLAGDAADSEYALCARLGPVAAAAVLGAHRRDWLGSADFHAMAAAGLNAVRVPVGYWGVLPRCRRGLSTTSDPFVGPVWTHLDDALSWAAAARLGVLLDLHAHPGGQSGEAHTGRARGDQWTPDNWNVETALDAVGALAGRYGAAATVGTPSSATPTALLGLSVVNEPDEHIPPDVLLAFYRRAYAAARAGGLRAETVAFVMDGNPFRPDRLAPGGYVACATGLQGDNLVLDVHAYQCFGEGWAAASLSDILHTWEPDHGYVRGGNSSGDSRAGERVAELAAAGRTLNRWVLVGEWSLRLPWAGPGVAAEVAAAPAPAAAADAAARAFGRAQVTGMAAAGVEGWFFWTWKTDACAAEPWWDFQECLRRGWLDPAWWRPNDVDG